MNYIIKKGNLLLNFITAHYKIVAFTIAGIIFTAFGIAGFFQYQTYRLEKGYERVATIQKYIDSEVGTKKQVSDLEAIQFNTTEEKWKTIEQESIAAQKNYGDTKLQGLFSAYQAQSALELGKKAEAVSLFKAASKQIVDKSLAAQYSVSMALLQLDSEASKNEGLETLQTIADQKEIPAHTLALYYLGEYAWTESRFTDAQNYWSQLVIASQSDKSLVNLELIKKAKVKLKLMKVS